MLTSVGGGNGRDGGRRDNNGRDSSVRDGSSGIDGGNDDRIGGSRRYLMEQVAAMVETMIAV
jgi:hypothetical protein